jgi:hypothetical protein
LILIENAHFILVTNILILMPEGSFKIPYQPRAVQAKAQPERVSAAKHFSLIRFFSCEKRNEYYSL